MNLDKLATEANDIMLVRSSVSTVTDTVTDTVTALAWWVSIVSYCQPVDCDGKTVKNEQIGVEMTGSVGR